MLRFLRKLIKGSYRSHEKRKDGLEAGAAFLIFLLELETSEVADQEYIQTAKNGCFQ